MPPESDCCKPGDDCCTKVPATLDEVKTELLGTGEPHTFAGVTVPSWMLPLAEELIAQYGPSVVAAIKDVIDKGLDELVSKYILTPK